MPETADTIGHPLVRLVGTIPTRENFLLFAKIEEAMSAITQTRIVFATRDTGLELSKVLGTQLTLELTTHGENQRRFIGTIVAAEYLGLAQGYDMFGLDLRAWPWFLTRVRDNRIFQDMSVPDIVQKVCADRGFTDIRKRLSQTYPPRNYCVQFAETDFDFIARLMQEEGIYFYFDYSGTVETLVLADGLGAHDPVTEQAEIQYMPQEEKARRHHSHIFGWSDRQKVVPGKVSLVDQEFTTPKTRLDSSALLKKGTHKNNDLEVYTTAAFYSKPAEGETYARIMAEAFAAQADRWLGVGSARTLAVGATFRLKDGPRPDSDKDFLIVAATHHLQIDLEDPKVAAIAQTLVAHEDMPSHHDLYQCNFEAMRKSEQFRATGAPRRPEMSGLYRAVVTGSSGEEIYTDDHGRIKVHFYWDRMGAEDESSSCWVRVMQPWGGKGWGMISIPRVGQEVGILFEQSNPDYPVCIGTFYDAFNPPPYGLPGNMTQTGIRTNSSKGGGGYNELLFEDSKGSEFVRMQSEKDYEQIIKNNAKITIGLEKADPGTMDVTVKDNVTETYQHNHTYYLENNLTEQINDGNVATAISNGDKSLKMAKGNFDTLLQSGNLAVTLQKGNNDLLMNKGTFTTVLDSGDLAIKLGKGDHKTTLSAGKMTTEVSDEIKFVCGASSLIMKKDGTIIMKGVNIKIEGSNAVVAKGGNMFKAEGGVLAQVKGGVAGKFEGATIAIVKGGITKIN